MYHDPKAIAWFQNWTVGQEFVALDVETTGLHPSHDRITEFGIILFTFQTTLHTFEQLVDPGMPISREASRVSGITNGMLRGKPGIEAVLPDALSLIGDRPIIAHNAKFDMGFLQAAQQRLGLAPLPNRIICTRQLAKTCLPGIPGYSLARVLAELKLPRENLHRALRDAMACRDIFLALRDLSEI